jgi:tetratricopeptide (TPR) repeat protein
MPAMRFFVSTLSLLLVTALAPALADDAARPAKAEKLIEKPLGPLAPEGGLLNELYARLKTERSPESARATAEEIRATLTVSGSATIDMLMANAAKAATDKKYSAALDLLDQVTLLKPDFAEGWNRRATVHYVMGNLPKAMSDTARVLTLEPRHLGALAGLAGIMQETGRDAQALQAWETYLTYYPADRDAQKRALDLINSLAGQKT